MTRAGRRRPRSRPPWTAPSPRRAAPWLGGGCSASAPPSVQAGPGRPAAPDGALRRGEPSSRRVRRSSSRRNSGSSSGASGRAGRCGAAVRRRAPPLLRLPRPAAPAARITSTTTTTATTSSTRNGHGATPSSAPSVRPRRYSGAGAGRGMRPSGNADGDTAIDAVDRQLIDLLRANGRASYAELARQVGLSSPAVHERVGKLEAAGVITGYRAVVDPPAVGLDVTALVGVIESDAVDDTGLEEALRALPADRGLLAGRRQRGLRAQGAGDRHPGTRGHHQRVEPDQGRRAHPDDGRAVHQVGGPSWLTTQRRGRGAGQ